MPKTPKHLPIIEEHRDMKREALRAERWRLNRKLTVQQLADLTGYSPQAVYIMERGMTSTGADVKPWAWQRYKMACAGVELYLHNCAAGEAQLFDWGKGCNLCAPTTS